MGNRTQLSTTPRHSTFVRTSESVTSNERGISAMPTRKHGGVAAGVRGDAENNPHCVVVQIVCEYEMMAMRGRRSPPLGYAILCST